MARSVASGAWLEKGTPSETLGSKVVGKGYSQSEDMGQQLCCFGTWFFLFVKDSHWEESANLEKKY